MGLPLDILRNFNLLRTLELTVLDFYFREFTAAINFPCSKSWLRIGVNENRKLHDYKSQWFCYSLCELLLASYTTRKVCFLTTNYGHNEFADKSENLFS